MISFQVKSIAAHLVIFGTSCALLIASLSEPNHNWDEIAYAALALSADGESELHSSTYALLSEHVSEEQFHILTKSSSYRETNYEDESAFVQQLPYYKMRVLFIATIIAISGLGFSVFESAHIATAVPAVLAGLVFALILARTSKPFAIIAAPCLFVILGGYDLAQSVGPDGLAFLFIALCTLLFLREKHRLLFWLLPVAAVIRTDLILFVFVIGFAVLRVGRLENTRLLLVSFIIASLIYVSVTLWAGSYGYSTLFHFVFVSGMSAPYPEVFSGESISLNEYATAVVKGLFQIRYDTPFLVSLVLSLVYLFLFLGHQRVSKETLVNAFNNRLFLLFATAVAYFMLHFALFPVTWSRFFVGCYYMMTCCLLLEVDRQSCND